MQAAGARKLGIVDGVGHRLGFNFPRQRLLERVIPPEAVPSEAKSIVWRVAGCMSGGNVRHE